MLVITLNIAYYRLILNLSSPKWDAFICHASEDKGQVAHPLAGNLTNLGLNAIWLYNTSIYTARCIPPSCWDF
jgi:hypothetical protein